MNKSDIPNFGNLNGLTVVCLGHTIAAPFAGELMAENGAKVIYIEDPERPDLGRASVCPYGFLSEHRNELCITLDLKSEDGQKIFLKLLETTDIVLEGFKGGSFEKMGLSDERLWEVNKSLVIVHVSGYGESGSPEHTRRPSYDQIAQASGGLMAITGFPDPAPPTRVLFLGDYYTALYACWSALAALYGTIKNGVGESIDVSQMEVLWKAQYGYPMEYFHRGSVRPRAGNAERDYVCIDSYLCKDNKYVYICCGANTPARGMLKVLGMENNPDYPENIQLFKRGDVAGERVEAALRHFCLEHRAAEVEQIMNSNNVPCSMIYDIETVQSHPQILARETFISWDDKRFGRLGAVNIVPKMKNRPGMFWGQAHDHGEDNDDVLSELGLTEEQIAMLYEKKVINRLPYGGYLTSQSLMVNQESNKI